MFDIIRQLEAVGGTEPAVAMATVVAVRGPAPGREGSKMFVLPGGAVVGSVTLGGCIDARAIGEADAVLASGEPRLLTLDLAEEEATEIGFSCAGTIELLVERLELSPDAPLWASYRRIVSEEEAEGACLVRLLRDPARVLWVLSDGRSDGSLGSASIDAAARAHASAAIARGTSGTQPLGDGEPAASRALFEVFRAPPRLIVVGAGPVSVPLVELGRTLGFRITVLDPRPRLARPERFPGAAEVQAGMVSELLSKEPLGPSTAVILTIHDPKVEVPALRALLDSRVGYLGMLGSRRRGRAVLGALADAGLGAEALSRVHVPVGLDIGARSPAEIALSALAELIAVTRGAPGGSLAAGKPERKRGAA